MDIRHVVFFTATTDLFLFTYPLILLVLLLETKVELVSSQVFSLRHKSILLRIVNIEKSFDQSTVRVS